MIWNASGKMEKLWNCRVSCIMVFNHEKLEDKNVFKLFEI